MKTRFASRIIRFALLPAIVLLVSFTSPGLREMEIKGKVRKIVELEYGARLDSTGSIVRTFFHDSTVYAFTSHGYLQDRESRREGEKEGEEKYRYAYTYYRDSLVKSVTVYVNGGVDDSMAFVYNANGELVEKMFYALHPGKTTKTKYVLENHRLVMEADFSSEGDTLRKTNYVYYASGRVKEERFSGRTKDGSVRLYSITTYNYFPGGKVSALQLKYVSGSAPIQITYTYNERGDEAETANSSSYGMTTHSYTYEYDAKGNWIQRIEWTEIRAKGVQIAEKQPVEITTRVIEYAE